LIIKKAKNRGSLTPFVMRNLTKEYILLNEDLFSVSGVLNIGFKWDHLLPLRVLYGVLELYSKNHIRIG